MTDRRFEFGRNWASFLSVVDEERIRQAVVSLQSMLGVGSLQGRSFLDAGCGSGLFSLAAMRMGAGRVHSLDVDPQSVACAGELRRRYHPGDARWTQGQGSVLDAESMGAIGTWDVVYCWGVVHHTGRMWEALENVCRSTARPGRLFVGIYNDQGAKSRLWRKIKALYVSSDVGRVLVVSTFIPAFFLALLVWDLGRLKSPWRRYRDHKSRRGMSMLHDWLDWLGGFPFEVARPDEVLEFCGFRGLALERMIDCGRASGCNQFVFRRD